MEGLNKCTMDIRELMQRLHNASTEAEEAQILASIKNEFDSLSDSDKEFVRKEFLTSLDEKLEEAKDLIKRMDIAIEMQEISKYVSLSRLAKDYFGKSKAWIYQRIKGYRVNGEPARFTPDELATLSFALQDISRKAHETSMRII